MNQIRRLIVRDSYKTTAGKVPVPVLPQFLLQMFLKSTKGIYFQTEGSAPAPVSKFRDISAMTVKPEKIPLPGSCLAHRLHQEVIICPCSAL